MQINANAYVGLQSEDALKESDGMLRSVNANAFNKILAVPNQKLGMTKSALANVLLHLEGALKAKHGMQTNANAYVALQ